MKKLFALLMATTMLSLVGCSLIDIPLPGTGNEQEEEQGNEQTGSEIPEEPLTSGPATVAITRATATTARFEGSIINDEVDLDFVQIIVRYAEPENFSAMSEDIPSVVVTRPDFDAEKKFSFRLEDLRHNTTYKFCAIVQYKNDVFYSDVQEFKTAGVNINLSVKEGSVTDNSVELVGTIEGFSKEDAENLEVGFYYSHDKSLVEKGEGTNVSLDDVAVGGVVSVVLSDLYMYGPTYHFRSYVKQGDDCDLGKIGTFELISEPERLVKKITRTEQVLDEELTWICEFEYDNTVIIGSKFSEIDDDEVYGCRFTYDYSTKGKLLVDMYYFDGSDEEFEQTYEINTGYKGNVLNYEYAWEDGGVVYNYVGDCTYSPEGYFTSWSETYGEETYGIKLSYVDGRLNRADIYRGNGDDDYIMLSGFSGNRELKSTNYDLNKALCPYFFDDELFAFSAVKTGTFGKYYLDQMLVESCWNMDVPYDVYHGTTTDANYKDVTTYSTYEFEGLNDDFGTLPITSVSCDKEGYPTEFVADVRGRETKVTITLGAGNVVWEDEYEGITYYEIVEVDRQETSGSFASIGKASVVVEYCE